MLNAADYAVKTLYSLPRRLYNNLLSALFPNRPYVVTEISDKEAVVGLGFNFDVSNNFGDLDNNINRYNASGLPEGLTINSSSGAISGTPTIDGSFDVTVTVSDKTPDHII